MKVMHSTDPTSSTAGFLRTGLQTLCAAASGVAALAVLIALRPTSDSFADPERALTALWWLVGFGLAIWWTASVLLCLVAQRSSSRVLHRIANRVAIPVARRLVGGTMALGLVGLPACGVQENHPEMVLIESENDDTLTNVSANQAAVDLSASTAVADSSTLFSTPAVPSEPATASLPSPSPDAVERWSARHVLVGSETETASEAVTVSEAESLTKAELPAVSSAELEDQNFTGSYVVQSGDNLWSIAKAHLVAASGSTPATAQVAAHWADLVQMNRGSLQSGNPSLIYPGEPIDLPALPG